MAQDLGDLASVVVEKLRESDTAARPLYLAKTASNPIETLATLHADFNLGRRVLVIKTSENDMAPFAFEEADVADAVRLFYRMRNHDLNESRTLRFELCCGGITLEPVATLQCPACPHGVHLYSEYLVQQENRVQQLLREALLVLQKAFNHESSF